MSDDSWAALDARVARLRREQEAAERDVALLRRIGELHERHPESVTVGDALKAEGVSLDQWLAAGAV